jgi:hypothetical protein
VTLFWENPGLFSRALLLRIGVTPESGEIPDPGVSRAHVSGHKKEPGKPGKWTKK